MASSRRCASQLLLLFLSSPAYTNIIGRIEVTASGVAARHSCHIYRNNVAYITGSNKSPSPRCGRPTPYSKLLSLALHAFDTVEEPLQVRPWSKFWKGAMLHHHNGNSRRTSDENDMDMTTSVDGAAAADSSANEVGSPPPALLLPSRRDMLSRCRSASVATSVLSMDTEDVATGTANADELLESTVIRLSSEEQRLFTTLESAALAYESGSLPVEFTLGSGNGYGSLELGEKISIRVAGGWVRDKILDLHSHDVDVAIDCMSGVQFACVVQAYLHSVEQDEEEEATGAPALPNIKAGDKQCSSKKKKKHSKRTAGQRPHEKHKIGVISANPSQSKHLETATMKIHNIEVDFVNLRAEEVYEAGSRIPTHETRQFGTPLEDALRRDFTINSLFYNIRDKAVEDWTTRGLDDLLKQKLIVTPLNPHTTFHDDPLRVLRAIRFGVRYGFELEKTLRDAAMSSEVHQSLHVKVSRERVGKELEGMLIGKGARPGKALDLITDLKLAGCVFCFPPYELPTKGTILGMKYEGDYDERSHLRERGWEESQELLKVLPAVLEGHNEEVAALDKAVGGEEACDEEPTTTATSSCSSTATERQQMQNPSTLSGHPRTAADVRLLHLALFLLPFRNLCYTDAKDREHTVVTYMIKESIKYKNKDTQCMNSLMTYVDKMQDVLVMIQQSLDKDENGAVKQQVQAGTPSPPLCRLETGLLLRDVKDNWVTCLLLATAAEMRNAQRVGQSTENILRASRAAYRAVHGQNLDHCWKVRPLLDGREIQTSLSLPKGPLVGTYLSEQQRWMLLNPDGSREESLVHLRNMKRMLEGQDEEQNETMLGKSDGMGEAASSPVLGSRSGRGASEEAGGKHFSKKMHVESMDLL